LFIRDHQKLALADEKVEATAVKTPEMLVCGTSSNLFTLKIFIKQEHDLKL
jgi:hypothetical protein